MKSKGRPSGQTERTFIETTRRTQIVACTIATIAELGYAHATLQQIAQRAGISKGVILYYFAGKSELIEQVVVEIYTAAASYMQPLIEEKSTAREMLCAYIKSNIAYMRAHPEQMVALVEIFSSDRELVQKFQREAENSDPALDALKTLLQSGQDEGEFGEFSTHVMAVTLRHAIDAIPPQLATNADLDLESYAQELANLFDRAVRKH